MTPLFHSLLTAVGVTLGALLLGFMVALWAMGLGPSGRRWVLGTAVVALAMPPFLVTNCWLDVMGTNGAWHRWLPWNLFSLGGAVWLLTLLNWPLATLAAVAAWARLESSALEIEPRMRGVSLIRHLLWPLAAPGLGWAAALIFVLALNNFAVPAILQVKVLPAEMWVGFNTNLDAWAAVRVGWPLLAAPFLLVLLWRPREIAWPRLGGGVSGELFRRQLGSGWTGLVAGVGVIVVLLSVALPLGQLVGARRTWIELFPALQAGLEVAWNSAWYAVATATLTVGIGCWVMARWTNHGSFPLTPALSLRERENQTPTRANVGAVGTVGVRASCLPLPRGEGRGEGEATKTSTTTTTSFKRYQSRKVGPSSAHGAHPAPTLTSLLWIPFFIPGLFLGLALIAIFNRPGLDIIYQGSGIILIAFVLRYLALGWFGALLAWRGLDRDLVDAGRMCGATGWPLWRQVLWPQLRSQLGAAWLVVYLLCLWDVETLVLILPPGGETLALRVFNLLHYGHNAQVNALCLWLLALALLPLLLWWIGSGWGGSTVPFPLTPAIRRSAPVPGRSNAG